MLKWALFLMIKASSFYEEQAKLRDVACLEKHVLLKKLRDALESLRGRVVGKNKDDVEEAISMVGFCFFEKFSFCSHRFAVINHASYPLSL